MPDIIIAVNNDQDIYDGRYIPFDLSPAKARLVFKDVETGETVQILYWDYEYGVSSFPDRFFLV